MFQLLVETRAPRTTRGPWAALSTIGHAAIIVGAVTLTAKQQAVLRDEPRSETVYYAPVPRTPPAGAQARIPLSVAAPMSLSRPSFTIPDVIAPATTALNDIFDRVSEELRHVTIGVPGGDRRGTLTSGDVHTEADVDRVVSPLPGNRSPAYPRQLSSVGIAGDVMVRFVVDTAGRVEPASVDIAHASHALFGDAVRAWLKETRYSPAFANGRAVRQLVQQRIGFSLER